MRGLVGPRYARDVVDAWAADLPAALSRIPRDAFQVGLVGHLPGDLAAGVRAVTEAPLLPESADSQPGRLLRIVHTEGEPELEEHTPHGAPWHWSTARPDPVPQLRAQATGLQAERAALTDEDESAASDVTQYERRVARLQQDVMSLTMADVEARRTADTFTRRLEAAEFQLARVLRSRDDVRARLPAVLADDSATGAFRGLSAAVLAPFHPATLDELAREDEHVTAAREAVAEARRDVEGAEARATDARAQLDAHSIHLRDARNALHEAAQRRNTLRSRADQLSRKRLALAQRMDDAAIARRATLTDDLAARLHGDPRGRLRLRWPQGGFPGSVILLVAPGSHHEDAVVQQSADDSIAERADALVVCARMDDPPDVQRVLDIRRMARSCPRVAVLFTDAHGDRAAARAAWASALLLPEDRLLAIALPADRMSSDSRADTQIIAAGRREREALGRALLLGPPVARAAGLSRALRTTAARIDAEVRRIHQHQHTQLQTLEAQRIVDIEGFSAERTLAVTRHIAPAASRAREQVKASVQKVLQRAASVWVAEVQRAVEASALEALRSAIPDRLQAIVDDTRRAGAHSAWRSLSQAGEHLLDLALAPLSERVRLTARATSPPDQPPPLPAAETASCDAVLQEVRAGIEAPKSALVTPASLAGGALGGALLGPLGVVLGAGAGLLAERVSDSLPRRRAALVDQINALFETLTPKLMDEAVSRLDGAEMDLGASLDAHLPQALARYDIWWHEQRDACARWTRQQADPLRRLSTARDSLRAAAAGIELRIAQDSTSGVLAPTPADVAEPPPLAD